MPPVPTPKGPSTVVANQGTLEMVGWLVLVVSLTVSFDTTNLVVKKN